jgi:hypothetical protein
VATGLVAKVILADCSQGKEVVLGEEIVSFGGKGGYETVGVVPSAVITEGTIPKAIEIGATFVFHLVAVVATVGTDTSQDFEEGRFFLSMGQMNVETGRKKKEPESIVQGEAVAKTTIDLSKGEDMANVEVREYCSEDKDRKRIEFKGRRRSRRIEIEKSKLESSC